MMYIGPLLGVTIPISCFGHMVNFADPQIRSPFGPAHFHESIWQGGSSLSISPPSLLASRQLTRSNPPNPFPKPFGGSHSPKASRPFGLLNLGQNLVKIPKGDRLLFPGPLKCEKGLVNQRTPFENQPRNHPSFSHQLFFGQVSRGC